MIDADGAVFERLLGARTRSRVIEEFARRWAASRPRIRLEAKTSAAALARPDDSEPLARRRAPQQCVAVLRHKALGRGRCEPSRARCECSAEVVVFRPRNMRSGPSPASTRIAT